MRTIRSAPALLLERNDTFTHKFDKPGIYKYVRTIHPRMMATITVK